jgi:hypothetical protein
VVDAREVVRVDGGVEPADRAVEGRAVVAEQRDELVVPQQHAAVEIPVEGADPRGGDGELAEHLAGVALAVDVDHRCGLAPRRASGVRLRGLGHGGRTAVLRVTGHTPLLRQARRRLPRARSHLP